MTPESLALPTDPAGWAVFATARQQHRLDEAARGDERLIREPGLTTLQRLELWNDVELLLRQASSESYLLSEAHPDPDIRAAAEAQVQAIDAREATRLLDRKLWAVFAEADPDGLDADTARLLAFVQRDFRRGGVDRDDATRARLRELAERDSELSVEFSRNIREGRRQISVPPAALAGLPQDFIEAHPAGPDGLVTLTTEYTDLLAVRKYATDPAVRAALWTEFETIGWPENDTVLAELLEVRAERARLLGYDDWADYETETRMAGSGAAIREFLARIDDASRDAATAEYERLLARLRRDDPGAESFAISDYWYAANLLKREEYDVDAQLVRSYFAFEAVVAGILEITGELLDVQYVAVDTPTWHEDVRSYDVLRGGARIGRIHLDLHPRDGKFNHAACFGLAPGVAGRRLPESVLLCNFPRSLMGHDDVVTFFHEFGHLVHGILGGAQRWCRFSGVRTEWDFVEAPSQLLEEWAWQPEVLRRFAHDSDGRPIPEALVERMRAADAFGRTLEVRRQLGYARTSYHLHVDRPADISAATERLVEESSPVRQLPGLHSAAGFGHLTGYGACYYTYEWSQVIARDLLTAFHGRLMDPDVARRYREQILEPGGSRDAADLVEAFLGRPYAFDAYREWLAGA